VELPYGIDMPENGRISRRWLEAAFQRDLDFDAAYVARRRP
jgi:hypothetical protein